MKIWRSDENRGCSYLERLDRRLEAVLASDLQEKVGKVVAAVRSRGDKALVSFVRRWDLAGLKVADFRLRGRLGDAEEVSQELVRAIELALANLEEFHGLQAIEGFSQEVAGSQMGIRVRPLDSVGVYVPGGAAVYLSSLLMAVAPARVAGVQRIAVATPPRAFLGSPELRHLLDRLGLHEVYLMGGAHAIAALAYGTESVTPVDKIVGPGGRWVAAAKRAVYGAVDVDLIAGPSELVILADGQAEPEIVAADMLSQAEHDPDALAVLITDTRPLAEKVDRVVKSRLRGLDKSTPVKKALRRWGAALIVPDLEAGVEVVNRIAPEHVELLVQDPVLFVDRIERAGAIYLGPWSSVVLGDYVVGSNHVLPTAGAARFASPLGVWDFVKRTSVVCVPQHRFPQLARAASALALAEDLPLHAEALSAGSRGKP